MLRLAHSRLTRRPAALPSLRHGSDCDGCTARPDQVSISDEPADRDRRHIDVVRGVHRPSSGAALPKRECRRSPRTRHVQADSRCKAGDHRKVAADRGGPRTAIWAWCPRRAGQHARRKTPGPNRSPVYPKETAKARNRPRGRRGPTRGAPRARPRAGPRWARSRRAFGDDTFRIVQCRPDGHSAHCGAAPGHGCFARRRVALTSA